MTPEKLQSWNDDFLLFTREAVIIRRPDGTVGPVKWSPRQQLWASAVTNRNDDGTPQFNLCAIVGPKRAGKTIFAAAVALWASLPPDRTSHFLGQSRESSESLSFRYCREMIERGPLRRHAKLGRSEISLNNGSRLVAVPCSPQTCAGRGTTGLVISDEIWRPGRDAEEALNLLIAQCDATGQALTVSQAAGVESYIYKLRTLYEQGADPGLWVDWVPTQWLDENPHIDPYRTNEQYWASELARLGTALFDVWHRNVPGEPLAGLFSEGVVERTFAEYDLPTTQQELDELLAIVGTTRDEAVFGAGLDRAMPGLETGSATSYSVTAKFRVGQALHTILVQHEWSATGEESEIMEWTAKTEALLGRQPRTKMEAYQCGDLVNRVPNSELGNPSGPMQQTLFSTMAAAAGEGRLHLPNSEPELRAEFAGFRVDTSVNPPRYGAVGRTDRMYGLAWALEAVRERQPTSGQITVLGMGPQTTQPETVAQQELRLTRNASPGPATVDKVSMPGAKLKAKPTLLDRIKAYAKREVEDVKVALAEGLPPPTGGEHAIRPVANPPPVPGYGHMKADVDAAERAEGRVSPDEQATKFGELWDSSQANLPWPVGPWRGPGGE